MSTISERMTALKAEVEGILDSAKAAGRDITEAECRRIEACADEHKQLKARQESADRSKAFLDSFSGVPGQHRKTRTVGAHGSQWAKAVTQDLKENTAGLGTKALFTGGVSTPPVWTADDGGYDGVYGMPDRPASLFDLVSGFDFGDGPYRYLRQVVRDDKAAVVPDGQLKPTSTYSFEEVTETPKVVAHLSEVLPLRYLSDHDSVMALLDAQMRAGVLAALEDAILNGPGGDEEEFVGILNTVGVETLPFAVDSLRTIRSARTQLEWRSETPTAAVMHPTDAERLELLTDTTGRYRFDEAAVATVFGNLTRVVSPLMPVGKVLVGNFALAAIGVKEGASTLAATQSGEMFQRNQFQLRAEGRFGFAVHRPRAFVVADIDPESAGA